MRARCSDFVGGKSPTPRRSRTYTSPRISGTQTAQKLRVPSPMVSHEDVSEVEYSDNRPTSSLKKVEDHDHRHDNLMKIAFRVGTEKHSPSEEERRAEDQLLKYKCNDAQES